MRTRATAPAVLALTLAALLDAAPAGAQGLCLGALEADAVEALPGAPLLRFGINPAGEAGALGPRVEPVPENPRRTLRALARLRGRGPFYVRLNRFFWSDGRDAVRRFLALSRRFIRHGYLVELQLRYHPRPEQEGDIGAWVRFVRRVVRRFGPHEGVRSLQVTNEVNFLPIAPDASDSAYRGAREALVRGVIAADAVARRRGRDRPTRRETIAPAATSRRGRGVWKRGCGTGR